MSKLDEVDLSRSLSRTEEQRGLENAWARLAQLRLTLGGQIGVKRIGPPVLVLLEGWDASGKGGAIKRLVAITSGVAWTIWTAGPASSA